MVIDSVYILLHLCEVTPQSNVVDFCRLCSIIGRKVRQQTRDPIELCYPVEQHSGVQVFNFHTFMSSSLESLTVHVEYI